MADDLPTAGALLVLEGVSEFINNMQAVTSGMAKVAQGLIQMSGTSVSTAGVIDNASQRIVSSNQRIGSSAQVLVDQYGKALSSIAVQSNVAASAVEESAKRIVQAMGQAVTAGSKSSSGVFSTPRDESTNSSTAAHEKLKQAQIDLANVTVRESNRRATAQEQATRRMVAALIAEANTANTVRANEERALARITQEQNAASNARVEALGRQQAAEEKANDGTQRGSLNFVRAITAMVAANNLLNVGALSTAFNIGTLAASFDRTGTKGLLLGGALGVALAAISSLIGAFGNIIAAGQAVIGVIGDIAGRVIDMAAKFGEAALRSATDYQKAMAFFVALTGAPIADLQRLNDKIFDVAQTTLFSMPKAADAVNELGRAGATTFDIIDRGALDATIALATAANGELALSDAAKTVTGTVGAFTKVLADGQEKSISYAEAVNAVTAAAQLSRLSFTEVTQAFRQAAPVANSANISISDLAAVIAILGNASETGTLSGTSLKQVILDLEHPSKNAAAALNDFNVALFDSSGKLRPFRDVIIDMNEAFGEQAKVTGKVTDQVRLKAIADIFGSRAALAANIISNQGVATFDKMKVAMEGVVAVDMANVMLIPLDARLTMLNNSAGALATVFAGPMVSALSDAVNWGIEFLRNTENMRAGVELAGQAIVAIATNQGFGALSEALAAIATPQSFQFFTSLIGFASAVRAAIMDVIVPALREVAQRVMGFAGQQSTIDAWSRAFDNLSGVVINVAAGIATAISVVADFVGWLNENRVVLNFMVDAAVGLAVVMAGLFVASFIAVAVPIAIVTTALALLGVNVIGTIQIISGFASAIMDFVATPAEEAANIVIGAGEAMAEGALAGAEGTVDAFSIIVEASAGLAEGVINNTQVMVEGEIDAVNQMAKGTAEGWDEIVSVTGDGVDGVGDALDDLDPVLTALANAPANVGVNWASGLTGVLQTIGDFVAKAWASIKSLLDALASSPLFANIAGGVLGFTPGLNSVVSAFRGTVTAITSIGDAAGRAGAAVSNIAGGVKPIIANFQNLEGRLRSSLDNIASSADRARASLGDRVPRATDAGGYPEKAPGGGGGGRGRGGGRDTAGDAFNKAIDQAVEFADDIARTIANAGVDAINKLEDIARKAADASSIAVREYMEKIASMEDGYIQGIIDRGAALSQSRTDREQKQLFDEIQRQAQRRRAQDRTQRDEDLNDLREGQDRYNKNLQDIFDRAFQYGQQNKATKRAEERADEDTAFKRKLDDEEKRLQKLEELRNKKGVRQSAEDIRKMQASAFQQGGGISTSQDSDDLEKRRLARSRAREDMESTRNRERAREDVVYQREEEQIAINRRLGIEDEALNLRHARRDADRAQRRTDEQSDLDFGNQQTMARQNFDDNVADEALRRTNEKAKQKLIDDRNIAGREHKEKLDAITKRSIEEGQAVIDALGKTLRGVEDKIKDKVPEILKSGGEAMQPILDDLIGNINKQMDAVWEGANKARKELGIGEGSSVLDSMVIGTNNFITASVTFTQAMIDAARRIQEAAAAISGGTPPSPTPGTTVPPYTTGTVGSGYPGYSNPAPPEGGQGFVDTPSQAGVTPSVGNGINQYPPNTGALPASSVVVPNASSVNVTNNTTYQVDASYANSQSPASIAMDLGALSAISRR